MSDGSVEAAVPAPGGMLLVALALGAALLAVVRAAVRIAPSDAELAATVLERPDSVAARRALFALVAREARHNRPSAALDEVVPRLAPSERAFLAEHRPDLLRRGAAAPR